MKILILSQTFPLTPKDATAHFMLDFAKGFYKIGHQVVVFLPYNPNLKVNEFKNIKVKSFKYIWPKRFHLMGFGRTLENDQNFRWFVYFLSPFYFLFGTIYLYKLVKKQKPDLINAHWILPNGFLAAVISRLTKTPVVVSLAGSDVYIARKNWLLKLMTKFTLNIAKRVISNSPMLLDQIGIKGDIISYPVPKNHQPRTTNYKPTIATGGRLVEKKGIHILKEIIPEIEIITGLNIERLRKKLLSVDIFVGLSIKDSKGNIDDGSVLVLEAMAAGCSVIVSDLPGYRKIIKSGQNGILVDTKNTSQIQKTISKLKSSTLLRTKLGQKARETIKNSYIPEIIAQEYAKVFLKAR